MPGINHFNGGANLNPGSRAGNAPILTELLSAGVGVRYTDPRTTVPFAHQDGSPSTPFRYLQAAVDYFFAEPSGGVDLIVAAHGIYEEAVVVRAQSLYIRGPAAIPTIVLPPTGQVPFTVTNATLESLAAYRASGDYADLEFDSALYGGGAGPQDFILEKFWTQEPTANGIEFLGVKGDVDASRTAFLKGQVGGVGVELIEVIAWSPFLARNVPFIVVRGGTPYNIFGYNVANFAARQASLCDLTLEWDPASIYGRPDFDHWGHQLTNCDVRDLRLQGSAIVRNIHYECCLNKFDSVYVEDTARLDSHFSYIAENLTCDGGASYFGRGDHIQGNLSFASGAGTARLDGGRYMGSVNDPDVKFVRNVGS